MPERTPSYWRRWEKLLTSTLAKRRQRRKRQRRRSRRRGRQDNHPRPRLLRHSRSHPRRQAATAPRWSRSPPENSGWGARTLKLSPMKNRVVEFMSTHFALTNTKSPMRFIGDLWTPPGAPRRNIGTTANGTSPANRSSESIGTMRMHIASGPGSDCRRKRSGRKPRAERTEGNMPGANNGIQAGRIHMRAKLARQWQLVRTQAGHRHTARMTWQGTFGSGWRIGSMRNIMPTLPIVIPKGRVPGSIAFFAAARGTSTRGTCALRTASGANRRPVATASASVASSELLFWYSVFWGRKARVGLLLLDFFAFCFVHPAQALLNSAPQLSCSRRHAVAQGAQLGPDDLRMDVRFTPDSSNRQKEVDLYRLGQSSASLSCSDRR